MLTRHGNNGQDAVARGAVTREDLEGIRGMLQPFSGGISKSERQLCAGTDGSVEQVTANIAAAVQQYGPSPGAKKMMGAEQAAAEEAIRTGLYGVWRNPVHGSDFCGRIGPESRCFCNHGYSHHKWSKGRKERAPACELCNCKGFKYIPRRPEEVGEAWLPRRRGFDINLWRPKCKCGEGHDKHDPNTLACPGRRGKYTSAWLCVACDSKWEDHESLWETEEERRLEGKPVGPAFMPLSSTPDIQEAVLNAPDSSVRSNALPHRPRPERSVRLMQERCPNYGGGSKQAALRNGPSSQGGAFAAGSLEDAFPPRGGAGVARSPSPNAMALEDAFPPRAAVAHALSKMHAVGSSGSQTGLAIEDGAAPPPRTSSRGGTSSSKGGSCHRSSAGAAGASLVGASGVGTIEVSAPQVARRRLP
mmetsp:Transcript_22715/g.52999  ORF Transcript_22715/g.52999 Transcript_22715/m.52999 type:complete len:418 (-) Transcript_22715:25-1278(-)